MPHVESMEEWEEKLIREGQAIRRMRIMGAGPTVLGKRVNGSKVGRHPMVVATVRNLDRKANYIL